MVNIPLRFSDDNARKVVQGTKFCTTRRESHAIKGDRFKIGHRRYEVITVQQRKLGDVAAFLAVPEGFKNDLDFEAEWRKLYDNEYDPERLVYVHWFRRVLRD